MPTVEYKGTTYNVQVDDHKYPVVLIIDGELYQMDSELCRGILLVMIRAELKDDSITFGNMTLSQIKNYFFFGSCPYSELEKVLLYVRAWGEM